MYECVCILKVTLLYTSVKNVCSSKNIQADLDKF